MFVQSEAGFSLVELILVILLIGILSVVITPNWQAVPLNLSYEANQVLNTIRYTQAMSLLTGQRYRWVRTSSTTYQILNEAGTAVILPTGGNQATLKAGMTFGGFINLPSNLIVFDAQGIPYTSTGNPGTALGGTAVISIISSGNSRSIQISPGTGFGVIV